MKKYKATALLLVAALLFTGCAGSKTVVAQVTAPPATAAPTPSPAETTPPPTPEPTPALQTEEVAPMAPQQQYAGVALANDVTPEMLQPDYWLQNDADADKLLFTTEQIKAFNAQTITELAAAGDRMFDIVAAGETMTGERVRGLLAVDPAAPAGDTVNGAAMPEGYLSQLEANRNVAAVPETVTLRYGVTVDRCNARTQPTTDMLSGGGNLFFDDVQQAELYWNEPLLILHESADGEWYYIMNSRMDGWVKQSNVALFATREEWLGWQQREDCLVVTANRMRLDYNTQNAALSEREISMGTVLPLADAQSAPQSLAGRLAIGNYVVEMPLRGEDGYVSYTYAAVPVSADVSRGYLPYTRRNVLHQLFKIQGTNYGWGGTQGANDCSGITLQVYRCFGFELARNSKSISMLPCKTVELNGLTTEDRAAAFDAAPAGSILYFPGHIMLYLGKDNGKYFVMSAVGSVDLYGTGSTNQVLTVLINDLGVKRKDGVTWLNQMHAIKIPEAAI